MGQNRNETAVGMFVIIGFILLTLVVFFISGVYFFKSGYELNVVYDYVSILDRGAPVRMAGVRVGEVSRVDLMPISPENQTQVRVKLFIERGIKIRENYLFKIQGTHILSEPHIEISPKEGEGRLLEDGDTLKGVDPVPVESLVTKADDIATEIRGFLMDLRSALQTEETGVAFKDIMVNLAKLTKSLSEVMSGSEEDLKQAIANIQSSTESLSVILDRAEKGQGTAGKLLMEDELYQELREFVAEIKAHPWRLLKKDDGKKKVLGIF